MADQLVKIKGVLDKINLKISFTNTTLGEVVEKLHGVTATATQSIGAVAAASIPQGTVLDASGKAVSSKKEEGKDFNLKPLANALGGLEKVIDKPRKSLNQFVNNVENKGIKALANFIVSSEQAFVKSYLAYQMFNYKFDKGVENLKQKAVGSWNNNLDKIKTRIKALHKLSLKEFANNINKTGISTSSIYKAGIKASLSLIKKFLGSSIRDLKASLSKIGGAIYNKIKSTLFDKSKWIKGMKSIQTSLVSSLRSLKKRIEKIKINPKKIGQGIADALEYLVLL